MTMTEPVNGTLLPQYPDSNVTPPAFDATRAPHVNELQPGTATLTVIQAAMFSGVSPATLKKHADEGRLRWYRRGEGGMGMRVQRVFLPKDVREFKKKLAEEEAAAAAAKAAASKPAEPAKSPVPPATENHLAMVQGQIDATEGRLRAQIETVDRRMDARFAEMAEMIRQLRAIWE